MRSADLSLAELTYVVARRLGMTHNAFPILLVGGTFKAGKYLLRPFLAKVREKCPRAKVQITKIEPALEAFSLAVAELQKSRRERVVAPFEKCSLFRLAPQWVEVGGVQGIWTLFFLPPTLLPR